MRILSQFLQQYYYFKLMNTLLLCDLCNDPFDVLPQGGSNQNTLDEGQRVPLIFSSCGCTLCSNCMNEVIDVQKLTECPLCKQEVLETDSNQCRKNMKLINFMTSEDAFPLLVGSFDSIPCPRHPQKLIEYFCKTCSASVCVKCMYDDHNGHSLLPVSEMANSLKQNIIDLRKMLDNTKRLIDENSVLVQQVRDELERLMEVQISNITDGFSELIRKLEEKKQEIVLGFEKKYKKEEQRLMNKQELISSNANELKNIEKIFEELVQFVEVSNDAMILSKIQDVTTFLHKSFQDLDQVTRNQVEQKGDIYIENTFKPLTLNVRKALEVVKKFEMVWPDKHGNDAGAASRKKTGSQQIGQMIGNPPATQDVTAGERMGLYKQGGAKHARSQGVMQQPDRLTEEEMKSEFLYENYAQNMDYQKKNFLKRGAPGKPTGGAAKNRQPNQVGANTSFSENYSDKDGVNRNPTDGGPGGSQSGTGGAARLANNKRIIFSEKTEQARKHEEQSQLVSRKGIAGSSQPGQSIDEYANGSGGGAYPPNHIIGQRPVEQDKDIIIEKTNDSHKIVVVGDSMGLLTFNLGTMEWKPLTLDKNSVYDGSLRYSSASWVQDRKVFLTGGCFNTNSFPSSMVFSIDMKYNTEKPVKKKNMLLKRYGHQSQYMNGVIYVLGGFGHKDLPNEMPVTLASCERYSVLENSWAYISTMSEPRSFASSITLDNQYIYVFGGMHDFTVLQTIEKYDTLADTWVTVYFTLPKPLAKLGACLLDRQQFIICGGMSSDFEARSEVYSFNLEQTRWKQVSNMTCPKLTSSGCFASCGKVYVMGGTIDQVCERYNPQTDVWQKIPSYKLNTAVGNGLFSYSMCLTR